MVHGVHLLHLLYAYYLCRCGCTCRVWMHITQVPEILHMTMPMRVSVHAHAASRACTHVKDEHPQRMTTGCKS